MPQFLVLGLDGAGKTTLLYRLKLGKENWKTIKDDMKTMRDPKIEADKDRDKDKDKKGEVVYDAGYHYEELTFQRFSFGMWDIPGTEPMRRVWSCFYHAIKVHGVFFVVNTSDFESERIELARQHLHILMNEDELRMAPFAVILNVQQGDEQLKDSSQKAKIAGKIEEEELFYRLGLHRTPETSSWRLKAFKINVLALTGENDKAFTDVMSPMKACLHDARSYRMNL